MSRAEMVFSGCRKDTSPSSDALGAMFKDLDAVSPNRWHCIEPSVLLVAPLHLQVLPFILVRHLS